MFERDPFLSLCVLLVRPDHSDVLFCQCKAMGRHDRYFSFFFFVCVRWCCKIHRSARKWRFFEQFWWFLVDGRLELDLRGAVGGWMVFLIWVIGFASIVPFKQTYNRVKMLFYCIARRCDSSNNQNENSEDITTKICSGCLAFTYFPILIQKYSFKRHFAYLWKTIARLSMFTNLSTLLNTIYLLVLYRTQ